MTDARLIAEQAGMVATAWSPPGSPPSWRLTAAQFAALRDDEDLLELAGMIPAERLPPLLFSAAATSLILAREPEPLRGWFPALGEPQPRLHPAFAEHYRTFCLEHSDDLLGLCARHRYQMNEVGRCADFVPPLTQAADERRDVALVDIGTGAGLALHFDRYRYAYRPASGEPLHVGAPSSPVTLDVELAGAMTPRLPAELPAVADRVGIDIEPLDLADPNVRDWLAACVPQEIGAVTRFHEAARLTLENPARALRGDACELLPDVLAAIEPGPLVYVVDTYVNVFFTAAQLERFREIVDRAGRRRDLDWVSTDPLVPMGPSATSTVTGIQAPPELLARNRHGGVFGVVSRRSYRDGRMTEQILGAAHPSALWLEWLDRGTVAVPYTEVGEFAHVGPGRPGRGAQPRVATVATAIAATPSSRPTNPIPSPRVALTLTCARV